MKLKIRLLAAILLIFIGILMEFGVLLDINILALSFPLILILAGSLWLTQKNTKESDKDVFFKFIGMTQKEGIWPVRDQSIVTVTGDIILDFTRTEIPVGETKFRISGLIGNIIIRLPSDVSLNCSSLAMANETRFLEQEHRSMVIPLDIGHKNYSESEKKINLETLFFVSELRISQV